MSSSCDTLFDVNHYIEIYINEKQNWKNETPTITNLSHI